jgi:hypothetical protein
LRNCTPESIEMDALLLTSGWTDEQLLWEEEQPTQKQ